MYSDNTSQIGVYRGLEPWSEGLFYLLLPYSTEQTQLNLGVEITVLQDFGQGSRSNTVNGLTNIQFSVTIDRNYARIHMLINALDVLPVNVD